MKELQKKLGYTFKDEKLLQTALTHSSYANEAKGRGVCNERLEFLGDSVLGMVTAEYLYSHCPQVAEGGLTKQRAALVCEKALAGYARELGLGDCLRLGHGEKRTGGDKRPSILSDAFESVLAAVYLDGGMEPAKALVLRFVVKEMESHSRLQNRAAGNYSAESGGTAGVSSGGGIRSRPRQALCGGGASEQQPNRPRRRTKQKRSRTTGSTRGAAPDGILICPHY